MPITVTMPALSPTMSEGTLATWQVKVGDKVAPGDVIAEIETDKATMEFEAVDEGTVAKLLVDEGTEAVPVNQPIAILLAEGEDDSALEGYEPDAADAVPGDGPETPEPPEPAPAGDADADAVEPEAEASQAAEKPEPKAAAPDAGGRVFASPLARRLAGQNDLDIGAIEGSGPHGRVIKRDIEAALASPRPAKAAAAPDAGKVRPAPSAAAAPSPASTIDARAVADSYGLAYQAEKHSTIRKTIARRLTESSQTKPVFFLTVDCEIDQLLAARKQLNDRLDGIKVSVNDFVIKAMAMACRKVPEVNAHWTDTEMLYFEHVHMGVAVDTPNGLITPVVRHAEAKGLADIAAEVQDLAARARDGKLKPEEYEGGTISVSNLGMFGIRDFTAIINPPQSAILAVGRGEPRVVVKDGEMARATVMTCTLTCDHRVIDGAVGARWLQAFKPLVEEPVMMLL